VNLIQKIDNKTVSEKSRVDVIDDLDLVDMIDDSDINIKDKEKGKEKGKEMKREIIDKRKTSDVLKKEEEKKKTEELLGKFRDENAKKRRKGEIFKSYDYLLKQYSRHEKSKIIEYEAKSIGCSNLTYHQKRNVIVNMITENFGNTPIKEVELVIQRKFSEILKVLKQNSDYNMKKRTRLKRTMK